MYSTVSSAQTGKQLPDTLQCYGPFELQKISKGLVRKNELEELVLYYEQEVCTYDSLMQVKDYQIKKDGVIIANQKIIIDGFRKDIVNLNLKLKQQQTWNKWFKIGIGIGSVAIGGLIIYAILK